jgi:hypothetical protein
VETYQLEKPIWDDGDWLHMGWHDAIIWSIHPDPYAREFSLDLDYTFKLVQPGRGETYFKFWVAPVTMVFENVRTLKIDIEPRNGIIEIAELNRGTSRPRPDGNLTERKYQFQLPAGTDENHEIFDEGQISFMSTGFRMFVRRAPELLEAPSLRPAQRGGVGFQRAYSPD